MARSKVLIRDECTCVMKEHVAGHLEDSWDYDQFSLLKDFVQERCTDLGKTSENWLEEIKTSIQDSKIENRSNNDIYDKSLESTTDENPIASVCIERNVQNEAFGNKLDDSIFNILFELPKENLVFKSPTIFKDIKNSCSNASQSLLQNIDRHAPHEAESPQHSVPKIDKSPIDITPHTQKTQKSYVSPLLMLSPVLSVESKEDSLLHLPMYKTPEGFTGRCSTPRCVASLRQSLEDNNKTDIIWSPSMETPQQLTKHATCNEDDVIDKSNIESSILYPHPRTLFQSFITDREEKDSAVDVNDTSLKDDESVKDISIQDPENESLTKLWGPDTSFSPKLSNENKHLVIQMQEGKGKSSAEEYKTSDLSATHLSFQEFSSVFEKEERQCENLSDTLQDIDGKSVQDMTVVENNALTCAIDGFQTNVMAKEHSNHSMSNSKQCLKFDINPKISFNPEEDCMKNVSGSDSKIASNNLQTLFEAAKENVNFMPKSNMMEPSFTQCLSDSLSSSLIEKLCQIPETQAIPNAEKVVSSNVCRAEELIDSKANTVQKENTTNSDGSDVTVDNSIMPNSKTDQHKHGNSPSAETAVFNSRSHSSNILNSHQRFMYPSPSQIFQSCIQHEDVKLPVTKVAADFKNILLTGFQIIQNPSHAQAEEKEAVNNNCSRKSKNESFEVKEPSSLVKCTDQNDAQSSKNRKYVGINRNEDASCSPSDKLIKTLPKHKGFITALGNVVTPSISARKKASDMWADICFTDSKISSNDHSNSQGDVNKSFKCMDGIANELPCMRTQISKLNKNETLENVLVVKGDQSRDEIPCNAVPKLSSIGTCDGSKLGAKENINVIIENFRKELNDEECNLSDTQILEAAETAKLCEQVMMDNDLSPFDMSECLTIVPQFDKRQNENSHIESLDCENNMVSVSKFEENKSSTNESHTLQHNTSNNNDISKEKVVPCNDSPNDKYSSTEIKITHAEKGLLQSCKNDITCDNTTVRQHDQILHDETHTMKHIGSLRKEMNNHGKHYPRDCDGLSTKFSVGGFTTALGKPVEVKEKYIKLAKSMLESEDINNDVKQNVKKPPGFLTASGKKVNISEKSLQAAKAMFSDDLYDKHEDKNSKNHSDQFSDIGSEDTAAKRSLKLGHEELAELGPNFTDAVSRNVDDNSNTECNKKIVPSSVGFTTASGKIVKVDEKSLKVARTLLDSELSAESPCKDVKKKQNSYTGFSTASGKKVSFSETSLKVVHDMLVKDPSEPIVDEETNVNNGCQSFMGFSTASGKKVNVSKESLRAAKNLLDDNTFETHEDLADSTLNEREEFSNDKAGTTNLRDVANSVCCYTSIKESNKSRDDNNEINCKTFVGFSTASGKRMRCSEEALKTVRNILADCDTPTSVSVSISNKRCKPDISSDESIKANAIVEMRADVKGIHQKLKCNQQLGFSTALESSDEVNKDALKAVGNFPNSSEFDGCNQSALNDVKKYAMDKTCATSRTPALLASEGIGKPYRSSKRLFSDDESESNNLQKRTCVRMISDDDISGPSVIPRQISPEMFASDRLASCGYFDSIKTTDREDSLNRIVCNYVDSKGKPFIWAAFGKSNNEAQNSSKEKIDSRQTHRNKFDTNKNIFKTPYKTVNSDFSKNVVVNQHNKEVPSLDKNTINFPWNKNKYCHLSNLHLQSDLDIEMEFLCAASESVNRVCSSGIDGEKKRISKLIEARKEQAIRINEKLKKREGKVKPGKLFTLRASNADVIKLKDAVSLQRPARHSNEVLYSCGVMKSTLSVTAQSAANFRFNGLEHFGIEQCKNQGCFILGDGALIILSDYYTIGKEEFCKAFFDSSGVAPSLISEKWVYNHYRWIVWKLAAQEISFPYIFGGRRLTPDEVMYQLKYRYDREIDHCQRSALKKIMERDDAPSKTLILCVAGITKKLPSNKENALQRNKMMESGGNKNDQTEHCAFLELTDGWYSIYACLDPALTRLVSLRKITVGIKLIISNAELVGSIAAYSPLEAPSDFMLKLTANSTRRARWDTKLGYFCHPIPFPVLLSSLYPDGGVVSSVDCVIARVYPLLYLEKYPDGGSVVRNQKTEIQVSSSHSELVQKHIEKLASKLQSQFERDEILMDKEIKNKGHIHRELLQKEIQNLTTGEEIFEALRRSADPNMFEDSLKDSQKHVLAIYREKEQYCKQSRFNDELQKLIAIEEEENRFPKERTVIPFLKIRIVDLKCSKKFTANDCSGLLTVWRPSEDLCQLIAEGKAFTINHISPSLHKGKHGELILNTTRQTTYQEKSWVCPSNHCSIRKITRPDVLAQSTFSPPFSEVDVVGLVFAIKNGIGHCRSQTVYLIDEEFNMLGIKFWEGFKNLGLEKLLVIGQFISATNIQVRSDHVSPVPCIHASDVSVFSTNPRCKYLQNALEQLKSRVKNVNSLIEAAKRTLLEWYNQRRRSAPEALESLQKSSIVHSTKSLNPYKYATSVNEVTPKLKVCNKVSTIPRQRFPTYSPYLANKSNSTVTPKSDALSNNHAARSSSITRIQDEVLNAAHSGPAAVLDSPAQEASRRIQSKLSKLHMYGEAPDLPRLNSPSVSAVHKDYSIPRRAVLIRRNNAQLFGTSANGAAADGIESANPNLTI